VVYWSIVRRLDDRGRIELDAALGTAAWPTLGVIDDAIEITTAGELGVPVGAPAWWHGDVEASQSFITAMGVNLGG
jgi:hypothetical protein